MYSSNSQCERCEAVEPDIKKFIGWRPFAYVADINSDELYDGNIEVKSTSIISHPSKINENNQSSDWEDSHNFRVLGYRGRLLRVNTNSQKGFSFQKVENSKLMDGIFVEESLINSTLKTHAWTRGEQGRVVPNVALNTELITDVLIVSYKNPLSERSLLGINDGFKEYAVKSAWDSLAELIGKQISLVEDIEPNEISVGKKFILNKDLSGNGIGSWAIFVTDTLDNGAGYASSYSSAGKLEELLLGIKNDFALFLMEENHSQAC